MNANNNSKINPLCFTFKVVKTNKNDTIYQGFSTNPKNTFITEFIKIEKFQGFSNAFNLGLYFRIKNQSSWAKSKQITGLWKTQSNNIFRGDIKEGNTRTLILFKFDYSNELLKVYLFNFGFYPHHSVIDKLTTNIL